MLSLSRAVFLCLQCNQSFSFSAKAAPSLRGGGGGGGRGMSTSATVAENKLLNKGIRDRYGGVVVEMNENEPMDSNLFVSLLKTSLSHWRHQGIKGVWIKLPIQLVNLVEPAVKEGFWFHHAEPNYVMLVHWIPGAAHTIPRNASHRVGIGAFVMNEKREIHYSGGMAWATPTCGSLTTRVVQVLVVQENSGQFHGTGIWKIPTGVVDQGEDICVAAVREVKEETSIDTKFVEVLGFRQSHHVKSFFGKSDLFFLCLLQPISFDIKIQEAEIEAARWMPLEEYSEQSYVQKQELMKYIIDISLAKLEGGYRGFSPVPTSSIFSDEKNYFYFNTADLKPKI